MQHFVAAVRSVYSTLAVVRVVILRELLKDRAFVELVGMDVSHRALEIASQKLRLEDLPTMQKDRIRLIHGSLTYRDKRLAGYDAATVVEVIEHQDPPRLAAFERVLFEFARPQTTVVTTPNVEYNVKFETLACWQDAPQGPSLRVDTRRISILG